MQRQSPEQPSQPSYPCAPQPSYTPPPQKKHWCWSWMVGILAVLATACAGGGNQGSTANSSTSTTQPTQASQATQTTSGGHKIGEPVTFNGWTVTVNAVTTSQGSQSNQPSAGNVYLLIDVTVVNQTGQEQPFSSLANFVLKDSTGQMYTEAIDTDVPNPPDGTIANGSKPHGTLAYDISKSIHVVEFDFVPDIAIHAQVSWSLTF